MSHNLIAQANVSLAVVTTNQNALRVCTEAGTDKIHCTAVHDFH